MPAWHLTATSWNLTVTSCHVWRQGCDSRCFMRLSAAVGSRVPRYTLHHLVRRNQIEWSQHPAITGYDITE